MRKRIVITTLLTALIVCSTISSIDPSEGDQVFFKLRMPVSGGGLVPDYALQTAYDLKDINIDVELPMVGNYIGFDWLLYLEEEDWDLALFRVGELSNSDLRYLYTEDGSLNIFGLNSKIPYNNESEYLQVLAVSTPDLELKYYYQNEWQNMFMDKILPLYPLFCPRDYSAVWANTEGYDSRWGVVDSLPYMVYDGYHDGQVDLTEFNLAIENWDELNPLFIDSKNEKLLTDLIFEPLLVVSPDYAPLKTGAIVDWTMIDDNHFTFEMRESMIWNPSYNTTDRNSTSPPLLSIPEEDLMIGLQGEFSNGSNQIVTAKDAVFSLLTLSNSNVSSIADRYDWLSKCYVDPVDDMVFHVEIDSLPDTPETDIYNEFWISMQTPILPEFFLNSTNLTISQTSGGQEFVGLYPELVQTPEWVSYLTSAFGSGKYMLDYHEENTVIVFQKSTNWFNVGAIDGSTQYLDIDTINAKLIPDTSVQLAKFLAGELDWMDLTSFPSTRKTMQADERFDVHSHIRINFNFIAFNLDRPLIGGDDNLIWLDESGKTNFTRANAIRKAICYAIDRDEMNWELHDGEYLINNMPNPMIYSWWWPPIDVTYDHDLDKAWEWMEAAGFERPYTPTPTSSSTINTTINFEILSSLLGLALVVLLTIINKRNRKIRL